MKCICADFVEFTETGGQKLRVVLLSSTTPDSLTIDGSDVDGMADNDVIAVGSILITPSINYIAFEDGVFTEKE